MAVTVRKVIVRAAMVIIGLPVLLVLTVVVCMRVLDRTNGALVSSGEKREYLLYVPRSYNRTKPAPLVISMHGAAGWPAQQMNLSRWNRLADEFGFIVVYPSGTGTPKHWEVDDVPFISDLIDKLEANYNIDATRIYADGLSNGGGMAFVLSCTLSDRIAAVGMVASAQLLPWNWCTDHRPVPMIMFHGTADPMVPYAGGLPSSRFAPTRFAPGPPYRFPSVLEWAADWARRNQCGPDPVESVVAAHVTRLEYTNCAGDAAVVLYSIRGGGHTWPGGKPLPEWYVGATTDEIDATALMWNFFSAHPLRGAEPASERK